MTAAATTVAQATDAIAKPAESGTAATTTQSTQGTATDAASQGTAPEGTQGADAGQAEAGQQGAGKPSYKDAADRAKRSRLSRQREAEEKQRLRLEREQLSRQLEWERGQRQAAEQRLGQVEQHPVEYLHSRGISPYQVAEAERQRESPEGQIKSLQAQLDEEKQARQRFEQQQQQERQQAAVDKAYRDFVSDASDAKKYPTLSKLAKSRPQLLCREGDEVMQRAYERTGAYPSFEQVLAYLEGEYSKALRDEPTRNGAEQGAGKEPAKAGQAGGSRTLTGKANERAQLPKSLKEMTPEERRAYFIAKHEQESRG